MNFTGLVLGVSLATWTSFLPSSTLDKIINDWDYIHRIEMSSISTATVGFTFLGGMCNNMLSRCTCRKCLGVWIIFYICIGHIIKLISIYIYIYKWLGQSLSLHQINSTDEELESLRNSQLNIANYNILYFQGVYQVNSTSDIVLCSLDEGCLRCLFLFVSSYIWSIYSTMLLSLHKIFLATLSWRKFQFSYLKV